MLTWAFRATNIGLNLRAAGEKPEALDAAGVSVIATRSYAVLATGFLTGLGGAYLAIVGAGLFTPFITQGQGYMAIVIAMLGRGRPWWVLFGSMLFGITLSLSDSLQIIGITLSTDLVNMLPFAAIIVALIVFARRSYLPPASRCPTYVVLVSGRPHLEDSMRQPDFTLSAGPTMAWPGVLAAQAAPITYHYDPAFLEAFRRTERKVGQLYRTSQDILLMQGEAILGLEAAARGLVQPGTPCLNIVSGVFGRYMGYWLRDYGAELHELEVPYDDSVDAGDVDRYLTEHPEIEFVSVVHSETPSGTLNPVAEIGPIAKAHGCLTFVDCVSSLGGMPIFPDEWMLDICVAGAQKCLAGPPGMSLMSVSEDAWRVIRRIPRRRAARSCRCSTGRSSGSTARSSRSRRRSSTCTASRPRATSCSSRGSRRASPSTSWPPVRRAPASARWVSRRGRAAKRSLRPARPRSRCPRASTTSRCATTAASATA